VLQCEPFGDQVNREPVGNKEPYRIGERLAQHDPPRLPQSQQLTPGSGPLAIETDGVRFRLLLFFARLEEHGAFRGSQIGMLLRRVVERLPDYYPAESQ